LDAVIGLPGNLFPTTSIPVAILVFDRSREKGGKNHGRKDVIFIDASRDYLPGKNQNALSDAHIQNIIKTLKARKDIEKYAHVAAFDEIKDNDFNLNIPRYVDTFEEEAEIDIDAVQQEIDQLEKELADVRLKMAEMLKTIER
jgi:type I restriction enzyme M protein